MLLSDEKREELKEEMVSVTVAGSSVRTKPGTDPDEAFDDVQSDSADCESEDLSSWERLSRWLHELWE